MASVPTAPSAPAHQLGEERQLKLLRLLAGARHDRLALGRLLAARAGR